ncbi:hypothetical protein ACLESO_32820 [Pyxidicoccus sp. 3LG]
MRILLTNHHLDQRAGSELYCLELSTALTQAGHQVAIFTFRPGSIAQEFVRRGVPVFSAVDAEAIEAFDPEVLHVQHAPCLYYLGSLRLRAAVLFSSLGVVPPLEAAPIVWAGVARGLAVSEEVRSALAATPFGAAVPLSTCLNWFDDRGLERPAPARAGPARRIAVVTNHLDARLKEDLDALCATHPGLEWTHLGLPLRSTDITAEVLRGYDRVVSIGRTPLLAAALQIPCLLYDIHGCDGLLSAEHFSSQVRVNLSGRMTRARPSREELAHLLLDEAERLDVAALADRVWREHRLSGRAADLVALYEEARAGAERLGEAARAAYGTLGRVYADAVDPRLHAYLAYLERELGQERERGRAREEQLTRAEAHLRELEAELEGKATELETARAATGKNDKDTFALRDAVNKRDKEILRLKTELNQKDQEIVELKDQQLELEQKASTAESEITRRDAQLKTLTTKADTLAAERKRVDQQLATAKEEARGATAQLSALQAELDQHQAQAHAYSAELEELRGRAGQLEADVQAVQEEAEGLRGQVDSAQRDAESLRAQLEQAQTELSEQSTRAADEADELRKRIAELEAAAVRNEERVTKLYARIKNDEKLREKTKKAIAIAQQLLDEPASSVADDADEAAA